MRLGIHAGNSRQSQDCAEEDLPICIHFEVGNLAHRPLAGQYGLYHRQ